MTEDARIFPPELKEMAEPDRFSYYLRKARKALKLWDVENPREALKSAMVCEVDSLSHLVRRWKEFQELGPPQGPLDGDSPDVIKALKTSRNQFSANLRDLESRIGKRFLDALATGDEGPIQEARKVIRNPIQTRPSKRILERRILRALQGFYSEHSRVPTKGELFKELENYPIDEASVVADRGGVTISMRFEGEPKTVSKKQFREAVANLQLGDLPKGKPGNPNFSNRGKS